MFIGHFALGYAAKKWAPQVSLGILFAAALFADLLWPIFVAARIEHVRIAPGITAFTPLEFISYPYSHSLVTLILWGALLGWMTMRGHVRSFLVVLALVVSHWVLDFVTHIPDMPLYPGGPKFGLGLWNSPVVTMAMETAMFAAGVWIYACVTRPRDRIGRWAFVGVYCVSRPWLCGERGLAARALRHDELDRRARPGRADHRAGVLGGRSSLRESAALRESAVVSRQSSVVGHQSVRRAPARAASLLIETHDW